MGACDAPTAPQPLALSPVADRVAAAGVLVRPGESIQAAIDAAAPGTVIRIAPGSYTEALTIRKPNLTLIGLGGGGGGGGTSPPVARLCRGLTPGKTARASRPRRV